MAETDPATFAKLMASVLPRVMQHEATIGVEHVHRLENDVAYLDFAHAYKTFGTMIGADTKLLEIQAEREEREVEQQLVELEAERDDDD